MIGFSAHKVFVPDQLVFLIQQHLFTRESLAQLRFRVI